MAIRASVYKNKKQEVKTQISMSLEESKALAKGTKSVLKQVDDAVKVAIDKAKAEGKLD